MRFVRTDGRFRTLFLDKCSGHEQTEAVTEELHNISKVMKFLPRNATHLCQLLDSFIIQKLKEY